MEIFYQDMTPTFFHTIWKNMHNITHTLTFVKSYIVFLFILILYSPMHDKSDQLDTLFLIFYDRRFGFFPPLPSPWKNASSLSSPSELLLLVIWASELFFSDKFPCDNMAPIFFCYFIQWGCRLTQKEPKVRFECTRH